MDLTGLKQTCEINLNKVTFVMLQFNAIKKANIPIWK